MLEAENRDSVTKEVPVSLRVSEADKCYATVSIAGSLAPSIVNTPMTE